MKAIRVHEQGGPEVLRYEEVAIPRPGAHEALVRIEAAGVNYVDIYYRDGFYWGGHHRRSMPYIPGAEAAGVVVEVGSEVGEVKVGDRVAYGISNGTGSYAEFAAVPAWHLYKIPERIDFPAAAAVMLQGMTAHYLTHSTYTVGPDKSVLIHAAAGGTGLLLTQLSKLLGARVLGTVSTAEKAEVVRTAGADAVVNYIENDFLSEARKFTAGAGVSVVYDSVGKETWEKSLDCLAPLGWLVIFGQSSGAVPPFDTAVLNAKGSLVLARPSLTHNVKNHRDVLWRAGDLFELIGTGRLKVNVGKTYDLAEAAEAHRALETRQTFGKLMLIPRH
ncbi:MAG TPA: quinone oxidoreductase [Candidatus Binatia bacterium]|jgi:NADPH2:quinone reductase